MMIQKYNDDFAGSMSQLASQDDLRFMKLMQFDGRKVNGNRELPLTFRKNYAPLPKSLPQVVSRALQLQKKSTLFPGFLSSDIRPFGMMMFVSCTQFISKSRKVLSSIPGNDRPAGVKGQEIVDDDLPSHRGLGVLWNI